MDLRDLDQSHAGAGAPWGFHQEEWGDGGRGFLVSVYIYKNFPHPHSGLDGLLPSTSLWYRQRVFSVWGLVCRFLSFPVARSWGARFPPNPTEYCPHCKSGGGVGPISGVEPIWWVPSASSSIDPSSPFFPSPCHLPHDRIHCGAAASPTPPLRAAGRTRRRPKRRSGMACVATRQAATSSTSAAGP